MCWSSRLTRWPALRTASATITMPPDRDAPVTQALLRTFPGVSVVAVGDIVSQVGELLGQMSSAIVAAASVAILAGIAVLIGAIAASRQARSYDSVILKTLGASRSEEHTSELQSLMRISYAVFCLKKKQQTNTPTSIHTA